MRSVELRKWRERRKLSLAALGSLLGIDAATLSRYENDLLPIPRPVELAVRFLSMEGAEGGEP